MDFDIPGKNKQYRDVVGKNEMKKLIVMRTKPYY